MKRMHKHVMHTLFAVIFFSSTSYAAEITPVNAVLFSNENAVLYKEADLNSTVVLPDIQEGLPIQVTGITDTGFFQVNLGEICYIPGGGLSVSAVDMTTASQAEKKIQQGVSQELYDVKQCYHEYILQVVSLVNQEREKEGLAPLLYDEQLTYAAMQRSYEMAKNNYLAHTRPNGESCFSVMGEYNITYEWAGENIAYGQNTPNYVVYRWMNSAGHKANILHTEFTKIGIGIVPDAKGYLYWTQLFARY